MDEKLKSKKMKMEKNEFPCEDLFIMLVEFYLGQMKQEHFYDESRDIEIYKYAVNLIEKKIEEKPKNVEHYSKLFDVANRFFKLASDTKVRDRVIRKNMTIDEFAESYREQILGDNKRKYDMSDLFRADYISSIKDKLTGQKKRKVIYMSQAHEEHKFMSEEGQTFSIQELGKIYMEEWNGTRSDISKYRIKTQIGGNEYLENEIYSNIRIINMDDPQYREAILSELLSNNNIQLSNTSGYIGEIIATPKVLSEKPIGTEIIDQNGAYFYKLNNKYTLTYDGKDVSAVMLYEQSKSERKDQSIINRTKDTYKGTTNYDDASR